MMGSLGTLPISAHLARWLQFAVVCCDGGAPLAANSPIQSLVAQLGKE